MKKQLAFWLAAALALCLTACHPRPAEPAPTPPETPTPAVEVTPTPTPTEAVPASPEPLDTSPWPDGSVYLTDLDLSSYEGALTEEEWEALQGFFPVLNNEIPMLAAHMPYASNSVTPTQEVFLRDIYTVYAPNSTIHPDQQCAHTFALAPVAGEELDLALYMDNLAGWYLLIHREGERFYAVYMPIRWFFLDATGIYMGSGSVATHYYHRLHFENGTFTDELLAETNVRGQDEEGRLLGDFTIGGEEVTEAEFDAWREENLSGDAVWYPAREKGE